MDDFDRPPDADADCRQQQQTQKDFGNKRLQRRRFIKQVDKNRQKLRVDVKIERSVKVHGHQHIGAAEQSAKKNAYGKG